MQACLAGCQDLPLPLARSEARVENVVKKISNTGDSAAVIQMVGDIMYGNKSGVNDDLVDWAMKQLGMIGCIHEGHE